MREMSTLSLHEFKGGPIEWPDADRDCIVVRWKCPRCGFEGMSRFLKKWSTTGPISHATDTATYELKLTLSATQVLDHVCYMATKKVLVLGPTEADALAWAWSVGLMVNNEWKVKTAAATDEGLHRLRGTQYHAAAVLGDLYSPELTQDLMLMVRLGDRPQTYYFNSRHDTVPGMSWDPDRGWWD